MAGGGADLAGVAGDAAKGGGRVHAQGERRHQPDPREEGEPLQIRHPSSVNISFLINFLVNFPIFLSLHTTHSWYLQLFISLFTFTPCV